jgi:CMP-2-keto-3-deoxyoctulosonic acid synthetase
MMRWLAVAAAVAPGPAGSMEVVLAPHTSEAVPFTLDVSVVLLDADTRTGARRCVEGHTVLRLIVGLGADRPTVLQRSVPQPPEPLTMAATTVVTTMVATTIMAATATPTALGSAQTNIDARDDRFGGRRRSGAWPPRFASVA